MKNYIKSPKNSIKEKNQIEEAVKIAKNDSIVFIACIVLGNLFLLLDLKFSFIPDLTYNFQITMLSYSLICSAFFIYMIKKKSKLYSCIYDCDLEENDAKEMLISLSFTNNLGKAQKTLLKVQDTKNIRLLKFFSKTKGELEVTYDSGIVRYRVFGRVVMKKLGNILKDMKNS